MRKVIVVAGLAGAAMLGSCSGLQRTENRLANRCEVAHTLRDNDTVEGNVARSESGWTVTLAMNVRLSPDAAPIQIRGTGVVSGTGDRRTCRVTTSTGQPGQPRFDADLCLDEFESLADLVADAQQSARPGETVTQEVRLRAARHHRVRSNVARGANYRETAQVTRDPQGRVIRIVRTTQRGGREELLVSYPSSEEGDCLPLD